MLQTKELEPKILTNSATSITLELPIIERLNKCSEFETAATEYTIYYQLSSKDSSDEPIMSVSTIDREVVLSNLMTFKNYTVYVEATNYYAKQYEIPPLKGTVVVVQTAAEGEH